MTDTESAKSVSFFTLGCKLNKAESDSLEREFVRKGYTVVPFRQEADVTIVNTCTVTNQADAKGRNIIRQAVKASPHGKLAVIGCYSQINSEEISKIPGVDIILGSKEKFHLFEHLDKFEISKEKPVIILDNKNTRNNYPETLFETSTSRTRAFLKIQDGCSYFCSYCIIPLARGNSSSRNFSTIIDESKSLIKRGYKEIVLTGVNIGTYNYEDHNLLSLLKAIDQLKGDFRLRISSIEINTLSDEILKYFTESTHLLPHFHLPLQSGSDSILKTMKRKYLTEDYRQKVLKIRELFPDASIGGDIICGFPGENDSLFEETRKFVEEIGFSYLHLFRYSQRKNTPAAIMEDQVKETEKKERCALLKELGQQSKQAYLEKFKDKNVRVLWERLNNESLKGLNDHYVPVKLQNSKNREDLINTFSTVRILKHKANELIGELI